ncbi:MAG: RNA chaperone Hfq, partial [Planifilum fimeticola]
MKQTINIQDTFLNQIRKESVPVTIYLINGFQLRGVVRGFDNYTIIIDSDGKQQMVYNHAISTFTPARPVSLMPQE